MLTQDPIGLAGGVNLYAYAGNNPVGFSDPWGLKEDSIRVVGASAQQAVDYMKAASPTFARDYAALDADPNVHLTIREPGDIGEAAMSGMQFSRSGDGAKTGTILFNLTGMAQANYDLGQSGKSKSWFHTAGTDLAHELGHAAGAFGHGNPACAGDPRPGGTGCIIRYENLVRRELSRHTSVTPRTEY